MPRRIAQIMALFALPLLLGLLLTLSPSQADAAPDVLNPAFSRYYWQHDGPRALGAVQSATVMQSGVRAQYFEKGRLEDHSATHADPRWSTMLGRVTAELIVQAPWLPIGGTDLAYGDLTAYATPVAAPPGFTGGVRAVPGGIFVPATADLSPGPGYVVADVFWEYMQQSVQPPQTWLQITGLPLTGAFEVTAHKAGGARPVLMQAFERALLTYDPANPAEWRIERANIGTDMLYALGMSPLQVLPTAERGPKRIEIDLSRQWLYAYEGDYMFMAAPISTGRPGFDTPPGEYAVQRKYPLKDMRGEQNGESWDVADVPHIMFFYRGFAIHGTYWHDRFGTGARLSHGCVNLSLTDAEHLYEWAPLGTPVIVVP